MNAKLDYENELWASGTDYVAGVDEVGRGCFAGPVVAACVGFDSGIDSSRDVAIKDSKKLTQKQRENAILWIKENSLKYGLGTASVAEINENGIVAATFTAMRRAIKNAQESLQKLHQNAEIEHLLVDAFTIPGLKDMPNTLQTSIVKGDVLSFSIAAASIVAKVTRDAMMYELSELAENSVYGWDKNKGYGTKEHREAILKYGINTHHRTQFVQTFLRRQNS